jgi:hypothetical protein
MPIYAICKYEYDFCGWSETSAPLRYIEAANIKEVEDICPKGHIVQEIEVETIEWVRIQQQVT